MSEKSKNFTVPGAKTVKTKRPSTVSAVSTSSRAKNPVTSTVKKPISKPKINRNTTVCDADITLMKHECHMPDFDSEYKQIAYGKFLRAMLEECLVDDKIVRDETQMDLQMVQLADRFMRTMDQLDKTSKRLKEINFVVEQKRLLDLKRKDCDQFYEMMEKSNAQEILQDLSATEQASLDKLETKNIDFGYNKESGHQQLLDAVNDAIEGLQQIKKHSNLDTGKFKDYENSARNVELLEKDRLDLGTLSSDFEKKLSKFSEKLLKEMSEKMARMIENDDDSS